MPKGTVVMFDGDRGVGEIEDEAGARFPFHCTQISDGSRTIESGTDVLFEVIPGPLGTWEAGAIQLR